MLRRLLLCASLLLAATSVPALATTHSTHEAVATYSFDGAGDATMIVSGSIRMAPGAIFVLTQADVTSRAQPQVFFPQVLDLDPTDGIRTYGALGNHTACAAPLTCSVSGDTFGFGISFDVQGDGKHPIHVRMFLAARGAAVTLRDRVMLHWHARHRSTGLITRTDADAAGAGAEVEGNDIGAMTSVSAPGATGGSVALAIPGCDALGAGVMTLTGGTQTQDALCPTQPVGALAWQRTSWQMTGFAAGVSQNQTRLVVLPI